MPSARACAACYSLNGKGYVFGGRNQNNKYLKDIWEYDPQTDSWTQITTFPGKGRVNAVMVSDGKDLYVGLGFAGRVYVDSCYLRDFWRYSPASGKWKRLADFESTNTVKGTPYVVDNKIYVLYSTGRGASNDVVYYDINADKWTTLPGSDKRAETCFGCTGAQSQNRCFFGLGTYRLNTKQWYEVDLSTDNWTKKSSLPGKGRQFSSCSGNDKYIYLFGGRYFAGEYTGGEVFDEFWRYDVNNDNWQYCGTMPYGRAENQVAFTIKNKVYFGLGEDENGNIIDKLYYVED